MPIYEYKCPKCEAVEDVFVRSHSEQVEPIRCCHCLDDVGDIPLMERVISKTSFTFVGGSPTGSKGHD